MQGLKITAGLTFQQAIFLFNILMIMLEFKKDNVGSIKGSNLKLLSFGDIV